MWLILLVLLVVIGAILILKQGTVVRDVKQSTTASTARLATGRYRIWTTGVDADGNKGRYYLVAYGAGTQQSTAIADALSSENAKPLPDALAKVRGLMFYYFRPDGDVGELTVANAPLYISPLGGVVNTTFTDYFNVQVLRDKVLIAPSGKTFANTAISVCNDASQCTPGILRFSNDIGSTVFTYEGQDDGFRMYQDGEPKSYFIVGSPLCPANPTFATPGEVGANIYNFTVKVCASLPNNETGGPLLATVSSSSASILHFTK